MNDALVVQLLASAILFGTPLLIAALGELLAERSGVLNLGVEGMMLVGDVCGFATAQHLGGPDSVVLFVAVLAAAAAGCMVALIHAFVTVTLGASQIVSGLAVTIFAGAVGLSSYLGTAMELGGKEARHSFEAIDLFGLGDAPVVGPLLFDHNVLVYVSWLLTAAVALYLRRTRAGLHLRAVGEDPAAADAMAISVVGYRYVHVVIGGAFAGVAGATYSLAIAANWADGLTAGSGWIAIALVIFAFWRPGLVLVGAYLFGAVTSLGFNLQARGVDLPSSLFSSLPYLMAIVVLVVVSTVWAKERFGAPEALGASYSRDG
jgi:simple sugar transport system permease protein